MLYYLWVSFKTGCLEGTYVGGFSTFKCGNLKLAFKYSSFWSASHNNKSLPI